MNLEEADDMDWKDVTPEVPPARDKIVVYADLSKTEQLILGYGGKIRWDDCVVDPGMWAILRS